MRSDYAIAKRFAEEKATVLANGEAWRGQLKHSDVAAYQRAIEICAGKPLELVAAKFMEAQEILGDVDPVEAARFYRRQHPIGVQQFTIPQLIERLMAEKDKDPDIGKRWKKTVGDQLGRFARTFTGPLAEVRGPQIDSWLSSLNVGKYTLKHYRAAVSHLVKYARRTGAVSNSWDELVHVPSIKAKAVEEIKILTPEQITKLLSIATDRTIPFIALSAFAGIRNEEMAGEAPVLDWRDINFEKGTIKVPKAVGKTGKTTGDRFAPLSPNLAEWLKPYEKPNGPVCDLSGASAELCRIIRRAGIPVGKNETRNTLRKSFISYRVASGEDIVKVAKEAGTSVLKIESNYLELATMTEAQRWFEIWPTNAGIVQLNFAGLS